MVIYTLHGLNVSWIIYSCPKPGILGNTFSFLMRAQSLLQTVVREFLNSFLKTQPQPHRPRAPLRSPNPLCSSCVSNLKEAQNLCSWIFSKSWLRGRSKHDPVRGWKHRWDRPLEQQGVGRTLYSRLRFAGCYSLWVHPPLPFHQIPSPSGQWQPRAESHSLINVTFRTEMKAIISQSNTWGKIPLCFRLQSTQQFYWQSFQILSIKSVFIMEE